MIGYSIVTAESFFLQSARLATNGSTTGESKAPPPILHEFESVEVLTDSVKEGVSEEGVPLPKDKLNSSSRLSKVIYSLNPNYTFSLSSFFYWFLLFEIFLSLKVISYFYFISFLGWRFAIQFLPSQIWRTLSIFGLVWEGAFSNWNLSLRFFCYYYRISTNCSCRNLLRLEEPVFAGPGFGSPAPDIIGQDQGYQHSNAQRRWRSSTSHHYWCFWIYKITYSFYLFCD